MLLRESGKKLELALNLRGVVDRSEDVGVPNEASLVAFADAAWGTDESALAAPRAAVLEALGPSGLVESAATAAMFSTVDRIANAIGIPLDDMAIGATTDFREVLGVNAFGSARNTLGDAWSGAA